MLDARLNRQIHALLNKLDAVDQKAKIIAQMTGGRTAAIGDMTDAEGKRLVKSLQESEVRELKPMRGKVIHLLCLLGYVNHSGQADFERMNAYIADIGSNNPNRRELFGLHKTELRLVLNQIEARYRRTLVHS